MIQVFGDIKVLGSNTFNLGSEVVTLPITKGTNGQYLKTLGTGETVWSNIEIDTELKTYKKLIEITDLANLAAHSESALMLDTGYVLLSFNMILLTATGITPNDDFGMVSPASGQSGMWYPLNYDYNFTNNTGGTVSLKALIILNCIDTNGYL